MKKIEKNKILYAIYDNKKSLSYRDAGLYDTGTTWYGDNEQGLQASRMVCEGQKEYATHRHIINKRNIDRTQEAMICVNGCAEIKVYDNNKELLDTLTLNAGDIAILYNGYHGLKILSSNTIIYEVKCGQFTSVEKDKEYYI